MSIRREALPESLGPETVVSVASIRRLLISDVDGTQGHPKTVLQSPDKTVKVLVAVLVALASPN